MLLDYLQEHIGILEFAPLYARCCALHIGAAMTTVGIITRDRNDDTPHPMFLDFTERVLLGEGMRSTHPCMLLRAKLVTALMKSSHAVRNYDKMGLVAKTWNFFVSGKCPSVLKFGSGGARTGQRGMETVPDLIMPSEASSSARYEIARSLDSVDDGSWLRNSRVSLGLSQKDIAELVGCSATYISLVERGNASISDGIKKKVSDLVGMGE